MNKRSLVIGGCSALLSLGFIFGSYAQRRNSNSASTFLKSQAATVKLGVWDKFGDPKNYTAMFVVTAPNGKENRVQKRVAPDGGWVYVSFPDEFEGGAPDYSTFTSYKWKCIVDGKVVANGQFQWGSSRASAP
jgi:hypothetical protein